MNLLTAEFLQALQEESIGFRANVTSTLGLMLVVLLRFFDVLKVWLSVDEFHRDDVGDFIMVAKKTTNLMNPLICFVFCIDRLRLREYPIISTANLALYLLSSRSLGASCAFESHFIQIYRLV